MKLKTQTLMQLNTRMTAGFNCVDTKLTNADMALAMC